MENKDNGTESKRHESTLEALCDKAKPNMTITVVKYGNVIYSGDPKAAKESIDTAGLLVVEMQEEQHHFTGLAYKLIVVVIDRDDDDEDYSMGGIIPPGFFG